LVFGVCEKNPPLQTKNQSQGGGGALEKKKRVGGQQRDIPRVKKSHPTPPKKKGVLFSRLKPADEPGGQKTPGRI